MVVNKGVIEKSILIIFVFLFTYLCFAPFMDRSISHTYPIGHNANDNYNFLGYSNSLKEHGTYDVLEPYLSYGYTDTIAFHPPMIHYLVVMLSNNNNLATYDSMLIICFFFSIVAILLFYLIIRKIDVELALLSLPLMGMLYPNFPNKLLLKILWGQFPFILGTALFILFFWAMQRFEMKGSGFLISISIIGMVFSHTSEFIFAMFFLAIFTVYRYFIKGLDRPFFKKIIVIGIPSFMVSAYYLYIFYFTFMSTRPYYFYMLFNKENMMFASFEHLFPWMNILIFIGLFLSLTLYKKKNYYPFMIGTFIVLISFTNLIGFGKRGLETRYFFPIYLSVFFGYSLYLLINLFKKNTYVRKNRFLIVSVISLILISSITYSVKIGSPGSLAPEQFYEGMMWIRHNTPKDANVYYAFNNNIGQTSILFETMRMGQRQEWEDLLRKAQNGDLLADISEVRTSFEHSSHLSYFDRLSIKKHVDSTEKIMFQNQSICSYDYHFYPFFNLPPELIKFHEDSANALIDTGKFDLVYFNDFVAIIRNNDIGDSCEFEDNREN
jgi:hypothetical protein